MELPLADGAEYPDYHQHSEAQGCHLKVKQLHSRTNPLTNWYGGYAISSVHSALLESLFWRQVLFHPEFYFLLEPVAETFNL